MRQQAEHFISMLQTMEGNNFIKSKHMYLLSRVIPVQVIRFNFSKLNLYLTDF